MKLSVVMPVYNEIRTILDIVEKIEAVPVRKEILIVDDGSTDGTRELVRERLGRRSGIQLICHEKNKGKGAAVQTGIRAATGEALIIQDADLEYDPHDYLALLRTMENERADVVYGSRFLSGRKVTAVWHRLVNQTLTALTNLLYGARLTDMETCYKMFRTELIRSLTIDSNGFEIEAEITARLLRRGCSIREVPVSYKGRGYHEGKKIGWRDGIKAVWTLVRYRFGSR